MNNSAIIKSIRFNTSLLNITECDDGQGRVSLKSICDEIGLDWKNQKSKILANDDRVERFGVQLGDVSTAPSTETKAKQTYLIRLDRVSAFLYTVNPSQLAARGNTEAYEWLKRKHREWDDVINLYEQSGATKPKQSAIDAMCKIDRIKDPEMKRLAAIEANKEYGLNIPIASQESMEI